ncbi:hypothetical protein [Aliarcobacter skirrowii]|uniref:hypothetical protein n=1 Tax=Aliarcobacter skirrowii TaxID=28200 RepID=UPI0029A6C117|nr:hypothetical protein [Aliarcobacter skirrowii]MDX4038348.1 hypothetical protein [Aliarcobacter skirrowii]
MAKVINQNISKTKSLLKQDEILIEDVKRVVNEVKAKDIGLKKEVKENIIKSSPKVLTKKNVKKDSKEIDKDSTWESF